jgi:hypothetical protein
MHELARLLLVLLLLALALLPFFRPERHLEDLVALQEQFGETLTRLNVTSFNLPQYVRENPSNYNVNIVKVKALVEAVMASALFFRVKGLNYLYVALLALLCLGLNNPLQSALPLATLSPESQLVPLALAFLLI